MKKPTARPPKLGFRKFFVTAVMCMVMLFCAGALAQTCATPGNNGAGGTLSGVINTYYAPANTGTVSAGSTSIALGAATGAGTSIVAGDLVLIIQMQGVTSLNTTNTSNYGTITTGTAGTAGQYEFASVKSFTGGTLTLSSGLINSYVNATAAGALRKTFQVIRVPQYSTATLGTVQATPWNGSTGGVVALDVAGTLSLGGGTIDVSASGFRGGGGVTQNGGTGLNTDYVEPATVGDGGSKGEGIAGTPLWVYSSATSVLNNGTDGYPGGSFDRGAPANAGGGGTDGDPAKNDQNSGGGGGANGGAGGNGGNSWSSNLVVGGLGGVPFGGTALSAVMGGGGGSSTSNNSASYYASGANGGGIVIVRADAMSGTGTINANGATAQNIDQDGAGGGGAGGTVIVALKSGTSTGLSITANGGDGGNAWIEEAGAGNAHGPGGGGGGGAVYQSGGAVVSVSAGVNGLTTSGDLVYGAAAGHSGVSGGAPSSLPGTSSGAQCSASISGSVYVDANHSGSFTAGESWTGGVTVYVNLVSGTSVVQWAKVLAGTGAYTFSAVLPGTYTLVLTSSQTATTVAIPASWTATAPSTGSLSLVTGTTDLVGQNFGLFKGSKLTGSVFNDSGVGGGTPNDGTQNGTEKGIASVSVVATNGSTTTYDSAITDGAGAFALWIPATTTVSIIETQPLGYIATGGSIGTSSGAYTRTSSPTITFTYSSGGSYSGLSFGEVQVNTMAPDNAASGMPGTSVFYSHTFTALSGGTVTFGTSAVSGSTGQFSEALYYRKALPCTASIDATYAQFSSAIAVNAGDTVCIVVKEMIAASAPYNAVNTVSVQAQFTYTNASPTLSASYTHTDITTVGNATSAGLRLLKSVDKATVKSGDTLLYTITYSNVSSGTVSSIVVSDATPSYTTFVSGSCGALPSGITGCALTTQPSPGVTGSVIWTLTGSLASGASGQVTYTVKVQ